MKFKAIAYASHYGGGCRGCADENGVCPTSGLPCDPDERLKAAAHCLKAWQYGIKNGFMDNPFPPSPSEHVEPVAWRAVGSDGGSDVTDRRDVADQWRADGLSVTALVPAASEGSTE